MTSTICSSLQITLILNGNCHWELTLLEVIVTSNDSTICSSLQVTSLLIIFEKFFLLYFCILGNFTPFKIEKNFWKFLEVTVTWSDEQMVEVIEKWRHFKWRSLGEKWPSLLRNDDQMVEANVKISRFFACLNALTFTSVVLLFCSDFEVLLHNF